MLWEEYKDRLGCSTQTQMHFDLHELVQHHNLEQIEAPFTKEDIDNVIKTALR
jgi:Holliday junction resolvase RusA-like endonuclease